MRRGYTLIELLIVVALSGFVGFMIFNAFYTSKSLFNKNVGKTEASQQIRYALSAISRDIQNVLRSSEVSFVGVDNQIQVDNGSFSNSDYIFLTILAREGAYSSPRDYAGIEKVKYFLDFDKAEGTSALKRLVYPDSFIEDQRIRELCKGVNGINFRYLKNNVWHDNWKARSLPEAIEITPTRYSPPYRQAVKKVCRQWINPLRNF